jgi:hypothetical protein
MKIIEKNESYNKKLKFSSWLYAVAIMYRPKNKKEE